MFRLIQEDSLSSILSSLFRINAYVGWRVYGVTDALEPICITVLAKPEEMWGISQEICCTYFRCALFCCGYVINHSGCIYPYGFMWCIYPYHLGLLHRHWGNRMIAPVPVKQSWRIWVKLTRTEPQQNNAWIVYVILVMCYNTLLHFCPT